MRDEPLTIFEVVQHKLSGMSGRCNFGHRPFASPPTVDDRLVAVGVALHVELDTGVIAQFALTRGEERSDNCSISEDDHNIAAALESCSFF